MEQVSVYCPGRKCSELQETTLNLLENYQDQISKEIISSSVRDKL